MSYCFSRNWYVPLSFWSDLASPRRVYISKELNHTWIRKHKSQFVFVNLQRESPRCFNIHCVHISVLIIIRLISRWTTDERKLLIKRGNTPGRRSPTIEPDVFLCHLEDVETLSSMMSMWKCELIPASLQNTNKEWQKNHSTVTV